MFVTPQVRRVFLIQLTVFAAAYLGGCAGARRPPSAPPVVPVTAPAPAPVAETGVMLGIDVIEQQQFAALQGKRIGLLTHPAGVNRFGVSTLDVIRRDKRLNLVALFAGEHGIHGTIAAGVKFEDHVDERTGLPVLSLYSGTTRSATPAQLRRIDILVIDLQDIGTRSYTFASSMLYQIEACFQNNVEVMVLDRPNPLGGLKVSGLVTDPEWIGFLAAFRVPYVHGLTLGELARLAVSEPGVMRVSDEQRRRGRLTVVPMRGWRRDMTWPQTGLRWVATSPNIPGFEAVTGYPMTGLGAQLGGFQHGIGTPHPFRFIYHPLIPVDRLAAELQRRAIAGVRFVPREITLPPLANARSTEPRRISGLYLEVSDWNAWRPTELSFHMMQVAAAASSRNPFAAASADAADLFNKHVGSTAFWTALKRDGARFNVQAFIAQAEREAHAFQERSRRYWLYR